MIVRQIWTANKWRNYNYLIVCRATGEALAIDPLDHEKCLREAAEGGWKITQILNTHHHGDHIGGNEAMIAATGARLLAHHQAGDKISGIDRGLQADDIVSVGTTVQLKILDTPGHTMSHVCALSLGDAPHLFCGDTLFNAGAGNCHNGGHPDALYRTFVEQLHKLPEETRIYPGHDYLENNLRFTLDREPGNAEARALLDEVVAGYDPAEPFISDIGTERSINTFFRLNNEEIVQKLRAESADFPAHPTDRDVFLRLRELRNSW
ncbi:hydroxyacylglutathione hydrolase [Burkholderia sp. OK233]|nr:hydroxyacylglutathione hydrolase [Burkholderia sp. OK233]